MKNQYFLELTDTFGAELNYCHLNRFIIEAKSELGAIQKLARHTGWKWEFNGSYYKAKKACLGSYFLDYEVDQDWIDDAIKL
jgi:hypothetical protein